MNHNINPTLKEALQGNYRFNFENYISRGFDITGRFSGGFMGFSFLIFLISIVLGLIPLIGEYVNNLFVFPILSVGYYIVAKNISLNLGFHFDQFFEGFQDFGNLIIVTLIPIAISYVIDLVFGYNTNFLGVSFFDNLFTLDPAVILASLSIGILLTSIPIIYLTVAWSFAPHFVVFYKMPAWEAMETSRKLIHKKWFSFFGFMIVQGLIVMLGFLLICIGVLYFAPAAANASYAAFEDITKFYEENKDDDILDHLVEKF